MKDEPVGRVVNEGVGVHGAALGEVGLAPLEPTRHPDTRLPLALRLGDAPGLRRLQQGGEGRRVHGGDPRLVVLRVCL